MESSRRRGPATFQYFSLLYFPFILHSTQVQTRMFHQELLQLSQKRRSQPTHLRLISLIVLLSVFHLNTSQQNTKQSPEGCHPVWLTGARGWRVGLYTSSWLAQALYCTACTSGTGASTIHLQTSWHKWYFLQAAPTCATMPARLSQEESAWAAELKYLRWLKDSSSDQLARSLFWLECPSIHLGHRLRSAIK